MDFRIFNILLVVLSCFLGYAQTCHLPQIEGSDDYTKELLKVASRKEAMLTSMQNNPSYAKTVQCRGKNSKIVVTVRPAYASHAQAVGCTDFTGCEPVILNASIFFQDEVPSVPVCDVPRIEGADDASETFLNYPSQSESLLDEMRTGSNYGEVMKCRGPTSKIIITVKFSAHYFEQNDISFITISSKLRYSGNFGHFKAPESVSYAYSSGCSDYSDCGRLTDAQYSPSLKVIRLGGETGTGTAGDVEINVHGPGDCGPAEIDGSDEYSKDYLAVPIQRQEILERMRASDSSTNFDNVLDCAGNGAKITISLSRPRARARKPSLLGASSQSCWPECK